MIFPKNKTQKCKNVRRTISSFMFSITLIIMPPASQFLREAAKEVLLLMAGPLRKKYLFWNLFSNVPTAIKLEGGGVGLNGPAIKNRTFFRLPLPFSHEQVQWRTVRNYDMV